MAANPLELGYFDPLETEVVEHSLSLHLHQKTGQMPRQITHPSHLFKPIEYGYEFKVS